MLFSVYENLISGALVLEGLELWSTGSVHCAGTFQPQVYYRPAVRDTIGLYV